MLTRVNGKQICVVDGMDLK